MSTKIIQEKLFGYQADSWQEEELAIREILQEVALAGLSRSGFCKQAVFQGGTALRILYDVDRFSEDLDFILKQPSQTFRLEVYLKALQQELESYGIAVSVQNRTKPGSTVHKVFLKEEKIERQIKLKHYPVTQRPKKIQIKLEVDTNPPAGSQFETKYLDFPFAFAITIQNLPSLFAGKSHALLCREYVKGRDWYDFVWYVGQKTPINYTFLTHACRQQGSWQGTEIVATKDWYLKEMKRKVEQIDWEEAKQDVRRFLKPRALAVLDIWGKDFFMDRLERFKTYA
ncbi:MAG: nucleotidyl transferase AbiEii/AbiGii toxin family protein [Deltaproteobacteria bacterium]|nr:nucleotidyl transferase AbiEii/AbiGii toxin family protein [Deltaproteobacteria bacterium]